MKNKQILLLSLFALSGCSAISDYQYSNLEEKTMYKEDTLNSEFMGETSTYSYVEYLNSESGDFISHEYGCSVYKEKNQVSFFSFYMGLDKEFDKMYFESTPLYIRSSDYLEIDGEGFKFINALSTFNKESTEEQINKYYDLSLAEKYIVTIPELNKTFKSMERNPKKALTVMTKCLNSYYKEKKLREEKSKLNKKYVLI